MKLAILSAAALVLGASAYAAPPTIPPNKMEMVVKLEGKTVTVPLTGLEGLTPEAGRVGRKQTGKVGPSRITVKFPTDKRAPLERWHGLARQNQVKAKREVTIVQYDSEGTAFKRYKLENAWPSKIEIGALKAGSTEPAAGRAIIDCEGYTYMTGRLLK
jgi:phage tail-like protein